MSNCVRVGLALASILAVTAAGQAASLPSPRHAATPPMRQPAAALQVPLAHPLRVSQPLRPSALPPHKATDHETLPSPEYNPLKRRHMAMPALPGADGSEFAF